MIWDSVPWKREVERCVKSLRRYKKQKRWTETSLAKLEREMFFVAFATRKLIDSFKISDEVEAMSLQGTEYPPTKKPVHYLNWHRLNELYHLSKSSPCEISLRDFCSQIIHSFIFIPSLGKSGGLNGLFIASDHQVKKSLRLFRIGAIIRVLTAVAEDHIVYQESRSDDADGVMKIVRKSRSHSNGRRR